MRPTPAAPLLFLLCAIAPATRTVLAHPGHPDSTDAAPAFFLAQASPPPEQPSRRTASDTPRNEVRITVESDRRIIESNGWPDHAPGSFPRRGNPNIPEPQRHRFQVPLHPVQAPEPIRSRGGWWAIAVNGVPFEPGTGEAWNNDMRSGWHYEAATGFLNLGLDEHHAHVQPPGAYHYHALPNGLIQNLGGDESKMLLIAWAADGFPVYSSRAHAEPANAASPLRTLKSSYRLRQGPRPPAEGAPDGNHDGRFTEDFEFVKNSGDLDECNGRHGVTPEFPGGTYYYCITAEFPFVPRMWRGIPDPSFAKAGPPPGGTPGGGMRPPPPGGAPRGILEGGPGPRPQGASPSSEPPQTQTRGRRDTSTAQQPPDAREARDSRESRGSRDAQDTQPNAHPREGRFLPPILGALDLNKDGVLDEQEIAAAATSLKALDKNGDGRITPDEYRPMPPGGDPRADGPPNRDRPHESSREASGENPRRGPDAERAPMQRPSRPPGEARPDDRREPTPRDGAPRDGAPRDGAPRDGAPRDGAPRDGAPRDGAPRDGAPRDGAPRDGAPRYGAPRDGAPRDGAPRPEGPGRRQAPPNS